MHQNILITGGTVFVSKAIAQYFVKRGDQVTVINRRNYFLGCRVAHIVEPRSEQGNICIFRIA